MYILINNRPVDIFRIGRITQVYSLNLNKYTDAVRTLVVPTVGSFKKRAVEKEFKTETNLIMNIIEYVVKNVFNMDINKLPDDERLNIESLTNPTRQIATLATVPPIPFFDHNKVVGYYFGVEPTEGAMYIASKIYPTKEEADKSLKSLLELINTIRNNLVSEIEI